MNVVKAGGQYRIYGSEIQAFDKIPVQTYTIGFHPQMGFWLNEHLDLASNEDVVYGRHEHRANKILRSYRASNRNFGVILSGKKGIGKSLLARMIAEKGIESGLPVIIVDTAIPGISDFLASIEQEVIIIFDEFEKTFSKEDDHRDPQVELLSLFDGIDGGKKLFVITCNDPRQLNEFLVNRPGRFHYHFEITCPTGDEVRAYMIDKMGDGFDEEIEKVVKLASMADITYDCLRAIVFDLKLGYTLEDTLCDLNINYERNTSFDINVRLSNGWILSLYSRGIDLYSKGEDCMQVYKDKNRYFLNFIPSNIALKDGVLTLDGSKCRVTAAWDAYEDDHSDEEAEKLRKEFNEGVTVEYATFTKVSTTYVSKYVDV